MLTINNKYFNRFDSVSQIGNGILHIKNRRTNMPKVLKFTEEELIYLMQNIDDINDELNKKFSEYPEVILDIYFEKKNMALEKIRKIYDLPMSVYFYHHLNCVFAIKGSFYAPFGFTDFILEKISPFRLKDNLTKELNIKNNNKQKLKI